jgi:hypothetical protein
MTLRRYIMFGVAFTIGTFVSDHSGTMIPGQNPELYPGLAAINEANNARVISQM